MKQNQKHNPDVSRETFENIFSKAITELKLPLSENQIHLSYLFYKNLLIWNNTHNLTSITNPEDFIYKHFFDSIIPFYSGIFDNSDSFIDIGSGGGFPGIPLSIVNTHSKFTLLDKSRKKCNFLNIIKTTLSLKNVEIVHENIFTYLKKFKTITIRAVSVEIEFLKNISKNLYENGNIVLYISNNQSIFPLSSSIKEYNYKYLDIDRKIIVIPFNFIDKLSI